MANTAGALDGGVLLPISKALACFGIDGAVQTSITLDGAFTVTKAYPSIIKVDPGGAGRDVTLDAEADSKGLFRMIINMADAAESLTVKDDAANTICVIAQNQLAIVHCNGSAWVEVATIAHVI